MIKIGVTPGMIYENEGPVSFLKKRLNYIVQDMARYLSKEDAVPILIPSLENKELRRFIVALDGIVLQGGNDVAPETYNEKPIGIWKGDRERDLLELEIIKVALEFGKPILGICRGFQLLNVFFGGTLYQDIPTQTSSSFHLNQSYDQNFHGIRIKEESFLYRINKFRNRAFVNSIHHQGLKDLAPELEPIAWSTEDELVEAFCLKERRIIGVQWHPEFNGNSKQELLSSERLYDHFLSFVIQKGEARISD